MQKYGKIRKLRKSQETMELRKTRKNKKKKNALKAIGGGSWWYRPPALYLWCNLVCILCLFVTMTHREKVRQKRNEWSKEHLMTQDHSYKKVSKGGMKAVLAEELAQLCDVSSLLDRAMDKATALESGFFLLVFFFVSFLGSFS